RPASQRTSRRRASGPREGRTSVDLVSALFARFPPHRPVEVLDRLGDALEDQQRVADDDRGLEGPAPGEAAGIRRALEDRKGVFHKRPRGVEDEEGCGKEEDEEEDQVEPRLLARR